MIKTDLLCENCGIVVGWKNSDYEIAEKQVVSCGNEECREVVAEKAIKIFKERQRHSRIKLRSSAI